MSGSFLVSSARNLVPATGERVFLSTAGIISWTVPAGITSISIVVVGGGGGAGGASFLFTTGLYATGGGGGGGGLSYVTDIAVTPGEILEINVGYGGDGGANVVLGNTPPNNTTSPIVTSGATGGSSWVRRQGSGTFIVSASGGNGGGTLADGYIGGSGGIRAIGEGGSVGGRGGTGLAATATAKSGAGGGGAAGYAGPGGNGANSGASVESAAGSSGTHGGGAGGNSASSTISTGSGGYGGGVGIYGQRLDGVPPTVVNAAVTSAGPGSAFLTGSIVSVPTSLLTLTYSPNGISGLSSTTALSSGSNDDGFFTVNLPWVVSFLGVSYSQVFVGTNSYLTFGSGSNLYSAMSASNPPLPKIMVDSTDNSGQRIYFGTIGSSPNRRFIVRYEGTASTTGTLGSPNMVVEYQFYETSHQIDIHIISNARNGGGFSGIYNATGTEAYTFSNGTTAGRAYRFTVGGSVGAILADPQYIYAGGGAGALSRGTTTVAPTNNANQGISGAVRIIWPGNTRRFPDLNVMPLR